MNRTEFQVIPVIDVRQGLAVRALAGDRVNYRPLETPLAPGSHDPVDIARAYRRLFPFETLYIADLDGIEGRGANHAMQARVAAAWGGGEVWIDDGSSAPLSRSASAAGCEIVKVLGSESVPPPSSRRRPGSVQHSGELVLGTDSGLRRDVAEGGACGDDLSRAGILSLDFRGDAFLGPPEILEDASAWPNRVIVMTLARVGAGQGPDLARLGEIIDRAGPEHRIFAAGGVSSPADLNALRAMGAAGVLVATALHNGQIKTGDLEEIAGESL